MSEKLFDALEMCLEALETGANPGEVAKRFPELENDLLPLLETSRQARLLAIPQVPEAVLRRGKMRVFSRATTLRTSFPKQPRQKIVLFFPRLAVSLVVTFLLLFSGEQLVRASAAALPGDELYPVKRTVEDVRLLLVFNPESREVLVSKFEQERLQEVDELLAEGRPEKIKFAGMLTEQNGDKWVVSGVAVQILPESHLPLEPLTAGASILLEGHTNDQGYVEAERITLLGPGIVLPASAPTPVESLEDLSGTNETGQDDSEVLQDDQSGQNEGHETSSEEEKQGNNGGDEEGSNSDRYESRQREDHYDGEGGIKQDQRGEDSSGGGSKESKSESND